MAEEKKPMNVTQQKESQGKEKQTKLKSKTDNIIKEVITVEKIS